MEPYECIECGEDFWHPPIYNEDDKLYLKESQWRTWCSTECKEATGERYWTDKWTSDRSFDA